MESKILVITGLCIFLMLIPLRIWRSLYQKIEPLEKWLEKWRQLSPTYRGKSLQRFVGEQLGTLFSKNKQVSSEPPVYKFYTDLSSSILKFNQHYGTPLRRPLLCLQERLSEDIKFEQKIVSLEQGSYAQFVIASLVIWSFTIAVGVTLDIPRNFLTDALLISLQIGGVAVFLGAKKIVKKAVLGWFEKVIAPLCFFDSLLDVGLSCSEVTRLSKIGDAGEIFEKRFPGESLRLEGMLNKWQKQGSPIREEWSIFLRDVWSLAQEKFETYTKCLQIIKFVILALFFLSSYFIYLSSLFEQFFIM